MKSDITIHGVLLWASLGFLFPVGILIIRMSSREETGSTRFKAFFYLHVILQVSSSFLFCILFMNVHDLIFKEKIKIKVVYVIHYINVYPLIFFNMTQDANSELQYVIIEALILAYNIIIITKSL
jgi:hypothetical protein